MPTRKGTPRGLGDELAERLERGMEKPEGWMDEAHGASEEQRVASIDVKRSSRAGHWQSAPAYILGTGR